MASFVRFYKFDFGKNEDLEAGVISWDGKKMAADTDLTKEILAETTATGIYDYTVRMNPKKFFPKDGILFLKQLKYRYDNPYLRAGDVETK